MTENYKSLGKIVQKQGKRHPRRVVTEEPESANSTELCGKREKVIGFEGRVRR